MAVLRGFNKRSVCLLLCVFPQVLVLTFDAVLAFYSFSVGGPPGAATGRGAGGKEPLSPVCEQRLGRWHASTCAMAFHAGEEN